MAGPGGAKAPDYRPRPPAGPGRLANRADLTDGRRAAGGINPVTQTPSPPLTGVEGEYGQRTEMQALAGDAPMSGRRPPGRPPGLPKELRDGGLAALPGPGEEEEPQLGPPVDDDDAYSPELLNQLEDLLPLFARMAADPAASAEFIAMAQLATEKVQNAREASMPVPQWIGPSPDRMGEG